MRGYRFQLVALAVAGLIFVISVFIRISQPQQTPPGTATPIPPTPEIVAVDPTVSQPDVVSVSQADPVPTFREGLVGEVTRLNPLFSPANSTEADITALIFQGLVSTNGHGEPIGALADRWVISSTGLEYTVFLRQDILWQDGVPFTADDVMYTMSILRDPEFSGPGELSAFWQTVETEKLDPYIVRFRLTQPLGTFLDRLQIGILPVHALEGTRAAQLASHPFNLTPIGTGLYQLESILSDGSRISQVNLRAAPVYRQREENAAASLIERIWFTIFRSEEEAQAALISGQIDAFASTDVQQRPDLFLAANNNDLLIQNQLENTLGLILFNWQSESAPFFRDQRFRTALAAGLDRDAVILRTMGNLAVPADSPLLPGSWAYRSDLNWPTYDPAYAHQLIDQSAERIRRLSGDEDAVAQPSSGQVAPGALPTATWTPTPPPANVFAFSLLVPDRPELTALAQEVASQWSQLGLEVTVDAVDEATYGQRLRDGQFDAVIAELSLGDSADPDVYDFWNQGQYPDGENYSGVDDLQISTILERARRDPWGINRQQDYAAFQQEFADKVIALPLYYPLFTYVTSPRVEGVQLGFISTPADRFRNIREWQIR